MALAGRWRSCKQRSAWTGQAGRGGGFLPHHMSYRSDYHMHHLSLRLARALTFVFPRQM